MKIFNLDDNKNAVEITVGGTTFVIKKVVLSAHILYGEYIKESARFIEQVRAGEISEENPDGLDEYVTAKVNRLDGIMDRILSKNGYVYDKEWWADNVESYHDIEQFIAQCLNKDHDDKKKEDQTQEKSTTTD